VVVLLPIIVAVAIVVSFGVSASAGLGGSLILVPTLALLMGSKSGIALAALLLATNNVVKVFAYRDSLPFRRAGMIVLLVALGAAVGARLLVSAPETAVTLAVIAAFIGSFVVERLEVPAFRRAGGPVLAFGSGATSGFSGTSGPLKGVAIRSLDLDRRHFVGAASLASLAGDASKTIIFAEADLIGRTGFLLALASVPLMFGATFAGRHINRSLGERGYSMLFWGVMVGYTMRLALRV
jgi:uncharacterized membrane protein YfcA